MRRALPAPCHLYVPFGFLVNVLVGVFGVVVVVEDMVDEEVVGNSELVPGESARDGLFEKRNGWVSSRKWQDECLRFGGSVRYKKGCLPSALSMVS